MEALTNAPIHFLGRLVVSDRHVTNVDQKMPVLFLKGDLDYLWKSPEKSGERKGTDKKDKSRDKFLAFEN